MKDPFDRERLAAASHLKRCAKHRGRNHWTNRERRQMEAERRDAQKIANSIRLAGYRRWKAKVRAYWSGDRASHPGPA